MQSIDVASLWVLSRLIQLEVSLSFYHRIQSICTWSPRAAHVQFACNFELSRQARLLEGKNRFLDRTEDFLLRTGFLASRAQLTGRLDVQIETEVCVVACWVYVLSCTWCLLTARPSYSYRSCRADMFTLWRPSAYSCNGKFRYLIKDSIH